MVLDVRKQFDSLKAGGLLPSPQGVALAIARMALREDVGTPELTKLVKTDPAIAGRLLRYANSVGAGSRSHIASLSQAVTFLGLYRVRQLALAFSLVDVYRSGRCLGFDYPRYWSESLARGVGAQTLSLYAHVPPEESFTCGLLANIGQLGLATVFPDDYGNLLAESGPHDRNGELFSAERRAFSIDHAALSKEMLIEWGLPSIFAEAVEFHESPESSPFAPGSRAELLTWMLHLASLIANRLARPGVGNGDRQMLFHAAAQIGLEYEALHSTIEQIQSLWLDWGRELQLPGEALDLHELLAEDTSTGKDAALFVVPMRVVLIAADHALIERLNAWLKALGQEAVLIEQWSLAAEEIQRTVPDVLLVDSRASVLSPEEAIRELRRQETSHRAVVVSLLPSAEERHAPELIRAGADDYLVLPPTEVAFQARMYAAQRIVALQGYVRAEREASIRHSNDWAKRNRRLLHDAMSDALTQLPNRRYGVDHLAQELEFSTQHHLPLSVIMIDIDHFKRINDTFGHSAGDEVLRQVAATIQDSCRKEDVVFRYGGEEFCVVCPATAAIDAMVLAGRMLDGVREMPLDLGDGKLSITISAGVATSSAKLNFPDALVQAADAALYRAKDGGRDQVILSSAGESP